MARDAWFSKDAVLTMERIDGGSTSIIAGSVTSFSESGGDKSNDYINVFGGGKITKENRQEPFEVSLDVIPTDLTYFEPLYGAKTTEGSVEVVKSQEIDALDYRLTITWADGFDTSTPKEPDTGEAVRYTYVNCNATTVTPTEDADGELTATITFSVAGQDADGNAQAYKEYTDNAATKPFGNPYGDDATRQAFDAYATV
jgi:hypothetical protein